MPSPCDSSSDIPDPFVIESSSHLYPPGFIEPAVPSKLKPYINVFRVDPFTTHDGVRGRPVPAPLCVHTRPEDTRSIMLEFQLSLGSPSSPSPESESNSEGDPALGLPPPDSSDDTIETGRLRYLDGDTAPSAFAEPPRAYEATWSPVPLFHPLPQPSRQSFSQSDNAHRSPPTFHAHSRFNHQEHPFTRVDHTPEPETATFRSASLMYPRSLACQTHHTGSGSESMYASESALEVRQESSNGYQHAYSSSNTSGSDGYPTHPSAGSHFYSHNDPYNDRTYSQPQQSFSFPDVRGDASSQHTLFATPAQMAIPSRPEGIYPSANNDPSHSPMSYPSGNLDSTDGHAFGHAVPSSVQSHLPADRYYGLDSTRLRAGDRRDVQFAQDDVDASNSRFSHSPHQAQTGQTRRLSLPAPYDSQSREAHFQATPRDYGQIASRGYEQGTGGVEQPTNSQYNSRSSSLSVFDRRGSITFDRPTSRTSSGTFNGPTSGAYSHLRTGTLDLPDPTSSSPPAPCATDSSGPGVLDRSTSRALDPFTRRGSLDSFHAPGTITPMRIFDSPVPTRSPTRSLTRSPTPSGTLSLVDRTEGSRGTRQFAPFPPGGMNRTKKGGVEHVCTVCNRGFKRPSTLATHMNTHTGERPHLCPVKSCGRRFSVSSNLRRHVKNHKLPGSIPRGPRRKATAARNEEPAKLRPRVLQERKNVQPWCPESLRGMRNAKSLSSRPPFSMPEGAATLPTPLPVVRPHGHPGDENYEDRDSFFYAHETSQPTPYHPLVWKLRPTLPGPLPSQADHEARARGSYGIGDTMSGLRTWVGDHHRA